MHEEQRVKASLEYRKTVGNEIASSILESTDVDDDAAIVVDDSTRTESTEIIPITDLHLFETLIFSLALTRSNLIGYALKLLQKMKAVDITDLPLHEKRKAMNAFHNDLVSPNSHHNHTRQPTESTSTSPTSSRLSTTPASKTSPSHPSSTPQTKPSSSFTGSPAST